MELDWKDLINGLDGPFPENGAEPPELERVFKNKSNPEDLGDFSRITTELYFFVDKETNKTYTYEKHWVTEFGEVPLKEAIKSIKKAKKE